MQGCLATQFFILLNAVMVVRYVFTFHLKNPVATEHDFWVIFITIWSFGYGLITFFVYASLPGRNPSTNYICLGKVSRHLMNIAPKTHYPIYLLFLSSVMINPVCGLRLIFFNWSNPISEEGTTMQQRIQKAKNHIVCVSLNLVFALMYTVMTIPNLMVAYINLEKISTFPHFFLIYYFHLCVEPLYIFLTITMLLIKNNSLRSFVYRNIVDTLGFEG